MKELRLVSGLVAIIDDEDYSLLIPYKWWVARNGTKNIIYASTEIIREDKRFIVLMHRMILGNKTGFEIDHKDRNGLNNQKDNLRWVTKSQNGANRPGWGERGFKGVYQERKTGKYYAKIKYNYRSYHLGTFNSETEAAKAYNEKAVKFYGEFAYLNRISSERKIKC